MTINKSADELYRFWRNFENLPRFMDHVESVQVKDDTHSHWKVKAPAGKSVEWDAVIINDIANELIAWKSTDARDRQCGLRPLPQRAGRARHRSDGQSRI